MNTPGYYNLNNGDVIPAAFQADEGVEFCRWLAIKYLIRAGKPTVSASVTKDLKKALDVIQRWLDWESELMPKGQV